MSYERHRNGDATARVLDEKTSSILVVDDEPQMLTALEDLLGEDYRVLKATSAKEALKVVEDNEDLAVILCDQRMPKMTGDEFLAKVKHVSSATRVLVTGYADMEAVVRAVNDGKIFGYVSKPWDPEGIRVVVHRAVDFYNLSSTLEQEQSLLHDLMDNSHDAIFFKDDQCRFIRLNKVQLRRMARTSYEEVLGKTIYDLMPNELGRRIHEEDQRSIREKAIQNNIVRELERDGVVEWWSTSKTPIRDRDGNVTGLFGISRNVTDQKYAEKQIRLMLDVNNALTLNESVDVALMEVVRLVCDAANWQYGEVWELDEEGDKFRVNTENVTAFAAYAGFHEASKNLPIPLGKGFIGRIWEDKKPLIWPDIYNAEQPFLREKAAREAGFVSTYGVPVLCEGRVRAILNFFTDKLRSTDKRWIEILEIIAGRIGSILERRDAEEKLIERGNQYAALVEMSPDAVFVHVDGMVVMSNPEADRIFSADGERESLTGKPVYELFAPEEREKLDRRIDAITRHSSGAGQAQYRCLRSDGTAFFAEGRGQRMTWRGRPAIQSVMRDISDRLAADEAIKRSEARFRTLIAGAAHGIVVLRNAKPLYVNDAFVSMFEFKDAEDAMNLESVIDLVAPGDRERVRSYKDARIRGEKAPTQYEVKAVTRNGRALHLDCRAARVPWDDGEATCLHLIDITEQREIEHQLRQAQKMEAVGQLTGGVAHDFNNLLTVIMGNLEMLSQRLKNSDDVKLSKWITTSRRAAQRGADLTRQLLAVSRRQVLEPELLEPNAAIEKMLDLLERTLGEHIKVEVNLADGLSCILTDPAQLESAILNLCINARDAMPEGGRLVIETRSIELTDAYAEIRDWVEPGEYIQISVSDTGCGMSPEVQAKVLEPFFTTKETGKGTGLGLSMVYGFVKQSEGHVSVYSEEGHGSTIKLYFPVHEASAGSLNGETEAEEAETAGTGTILIAEDNEDVREMAETMLENLGYNVISTSSGAEALEMLKKRSDIDLLFTDIIMPGGMTGIQLADQARRERPDLPVLYTSGYAESALAGEASKRLNAHWLAKPYSARHLGTRIREALASTEDKDRS